MNGADHGDSNLVFDALGPEDPEPPAARSPLAAPTVRLMTASRRDWAANLLDQQVALQPST